MWLEPPAFQEKFVKSPTFHNFADPILHNIVVKDIFAWVYLVSTEQMVWVLRNVTGIRGEGGMVSVYRYVTLKNIFYTK